MDPLIDFPILQTCNKHNQPSVSFDPIKNEPNCLICLQLITRLVLLETHQQKLNEIINKENQNYATDKQFCQEIYNSILNCKQRLIMRFDKILKIIDIHYSQFLQSIKEANIQQKTIQQLEDEYSQQLELKQQFKNQVKQLLNQFQKKYLISDQLITQEDNQANIDITEQIQVQKNEKCQIIKQSSKRVSKNFTAFALNKENSILVVAVGKEIIIYELMRDPEILYELQRLYQHNTEVYCISFMKLSDSFVSVSTEDQLIIWEKKNQNWHILWRLKLLHYQFLMISSINIGISMVGCIQINREDDLIIFSDMGVVQFCKKQRNSWKLQQSINSKNIGPAMSLNEFGDKLICGDGGSILVMMKESNGKWKEIDQIHQGERVNRLCFTVGDQFVCQSGYANNGMNSHRVDDIFDELTIYSWDQKQEHFQISQKVQIGEKIPGSYVLVPSQYIKKLKMISVYNEGSLKLLKINQEGDYQIIESIELDNCVSGLTDDGQYLITLNNELNQVQVSHFKLLQ